MSSAGDQVRGTIEGDSGGPGTALGTVEDFAFVAG